LSEIELNEWSALMANAIAKLQTYLEKMMYDIVPCSTYTAVCIINDTRFKSTTQTKYM